MTPIPLKLVTKNALRVQVPNNHMLTPNLYYNYYCPNPKYLIIGYMDPLGMFNIKLAIPVSFGRHPSIKRFWLLWWVPLRSTASGACGVKVVPLKQRDLFRMSSFLQHGRFQVLTMSYRGVTLKIKWCSKRSFSRARARYVKLPTQTLRVQKPQYWIRVYGLRFRV